MTNEQRAEMVVGMAQDEMHITKPLTLQNMIQRAIESAVTAALEEAAKVALDHDCKRDYCSAACVFGIGKAIRALIPNTGTKE